MATHSSREVPKRSQFCHSARYCRTMTDGTTGAGGRTGEGAFGGVIASRGPTLGDAVAVSLLFNAEGRSAIQATLRGYAPDASCLEELLIVDSSTRRLVGEALVTVLSASRECLKAIGGRKLGELVPGALLAPDGLIDVEGCGPRLRGILERADWTSWSVLLEQRLSLITDLPNVGSRAVAQLLGMCLERAFDAIVQAWTLGHETGDLAVVLRHERGCASQPLLEALLESYSGEGPAFAQEAAGRLLAECAPWALEVAPKFHALLDCVGDERSRALFTRLSLARGCPPPLDELATEWAISTTRVREIRDKAEARLRGALAASPPHLRWLVSTLRGRIGAVTTEAEAGAVLERLGVTGPLPVQVVLWLAGPYLLVSDRPGWLAINPKLVVNRTSAFLGADGGVRRLVDFEAELDDLGILCNQVVEWLRACGAVVVHDSVARVTGPLADALERLLDTHGNAISIEELATDLSRGGRAVEPTALEAALRGRRFSPVTGGTMRLTAWGPEGKPVVSGTRSPRPTVRHAAPRDRSGPGANSPSRDRLWLWVRVDAEVLRGSEAAVPIALVEGLGLAPLTRRTFSGRWGPVTLVYEETQATRGSVRPVVLAAGARPDDTLLLGFSAAGDVVVEVRLAAVGMSPADTHAEPTSLFLEVPDMTGGSQ